MHEYIEDMAKQAGATDTIGDRTGTVFCFSESELKAFVQLFATDFIGDIKSMKSKHRIKTNYGIKKG